MLPEIIIKRLIAPLAATLMLVCTGCKDDAAAAAADKKPTTPADPTSDPAVAGPPTSPNPRIKFKGPKRMKLELARILDLDDGEVCTELGLYDCFGVHNVALGGADPFGVELYTAPEQSSATTPLAVERVVLAGCIERAVRDINNPSTALIFKDLAVIGGQLDPAAEAVADALDALYTRSMQRRATDSEIELLRGLYADIEDSGDSSAPAQDWATLSCFTVLTTLETLFY